MATLEGDKKSIKGEKDFCVDGSVDIKMESADDKSLFGGMSLDVLAQVASDRLEIVEHNFIKKKTPKRAVQNMDKLDLTQIAQLSDKLLVSLFSDMTCDEIKKMYTLKCYLMPRTCHYQITVYGNEMKARLSMKTHLREHITELEKVKLEDKDSEIFKSEPVPARKKRLAAQFAREQKMKKNKKVCVSLIRKGSSNTTQPSVHPTSSTSRQLKRGRPACFPQSLQDYAELGMDVESEPATCAKSERVSPKRKYNKLRITDEEADMLEQDNEDGEGSLLDTSAVATMRSISAREEGERQAQEIRQQLALGRLENLQPMTSQGITSQGMTSQGVTSQVMTPQGMTSELLSSQLEKEQLIIDLMQRSQPFRDHNYTSILGKRLNLKDDEAEDMCDDLEGSRVTARRTASQSHVTSDATPSQPAPRITQISYTPAPQSSVLNRSVQRTANDTSKSENSPRSEKTVIGDTTRLASTVKSLNPAVSGTTSKNIATAVESDSEAPSSTPFAPQVDGEKQARLAADEADLQQSESQEDDSQITADANPHRRGRRGLDSHSGEWERKAALKCIRELRVRKMGETMLVCKICKDKTFTATATLLYHYRSHAGIKPFVCLICNTTFTRQHSLNYHMLIHNNQSRFTCQECGRKFRHPSHFKEHMRRHTGETPYHCTDCPLRFKTRNTYKRHLRTRHDKLLTSCGIQKMSVEEVALNRAMQAFAMEQQQGYQGDSSNQDLRPDSPENDATTSLKAIAPKTEPSSPAHSQHSSATSTLAMAKNKKTASTHGSHAPPTSLSFRAEISERADDKPLTVADTHEYTNDVRQINNESTSVFMATGTMPTINPDNSNFKNNFSASDTLQAMQSITKETHVHTSSVSPGLSFIQQAPLTCFTPLNASSQLVLGQPGQLQQFVMALPQQNALLATPSQSVTMVSGMTTTPTLVSSQGSLMVAQNQAVMATQQPLMTIATAQAPGATQNLFMTTPIQQLSQPILTALPQTVQNLPNVVQTSNAGTLTLAPPQGAQIMALNAANFIQPIQTLQHASLHMATTHAHTFQLGTLSGGATVQAMAEMRGVGHELGNTLQGNASSQTMQINVAGQAISTVKASMSQDNVTTYVQPAAQNAQKVVNKGENKVHQIHLQPIQLNNGIGSTAFMSPSPLNISTNSIQNLSTPSQTFSHSNKNSTIPILDLDSIPGQLNNNVHHFQATAMSSNPDPAGNKVGSDTPVARTMLRFCSQVTSQIGQPVPANP